jgi:hypothetical protein
VLEVAGPPLVYRTPRIVAPYEEFVEPLRVVLDAGSQGLALHYTTDGASRRASRRCTRNRS